MRARVTYARGNQSSDQQGYLSMLAPVVWPIEGKHNDITRFKKGKETRKEEKKTPLNREQCVSSSLLYNLSFILIIYIIYSTINQL